MREKDGLYCFYGRKGPFFNSFHHPTEKSVNNLILNNFQILLKGFFYPKGFHVIPRYSYWNPLWPMNLIFNLYQWIDSKIQSDSSVLRSFNNNLFRFPGIFKDATNSCKIRKFLRISFYPLCFEISRRISCNPLGFWISIRILLTYSDYLTWQAQIRKRWYSVLMY